MAIAIPASVDALLTTLRATLLPNQDGVTNTASQPLPPYLSANRAADALRLLTDLIDSAAMTVEGIHGAADAANLATAAVATNLATAQTLANDIKAVYNSHRILTAGGVHGSVDGTNVVSSADASDQPTLETLLNEMKADINLHLLNNTELDEIVTLANEIRSDYEAHRVDVTSHGAADGVNVIAAAACTDLATAIVLCNDIKAKFNPHIVLVGGGEHINIDGTSTITSSDATDLPTVVTLVNELRADYNAHLLVTSTIEECITLLNEVQADYNLHIADATIHDAADAVNDSTSPVASNQATAETLANEIKGDYNAHRVLTAGGVHGTADATNVITSADATTLATLVTLVNELKADINAHYLMPSLVEESVALANDLKTQYTGHLALVAGVHGVADALNPIVAAVATDEATAYVLVNNIKAVYNVHHTDVTGAIHGGAGDANTVTAADATTLATLVTLVNDIRVQYEAHRINIAGAVHGLADTSNITTVVAADTADVHDNDDIINTITAVDAETAAVHEVDDVTNNVTAVAANVARVHPAQDTTMVIASADASDLATALTLVNEMFTDYNLHLGNIKGLSTSILVDVAAFSSVNSLIGSTITFGAATATVALRGVTATVRSNTLDVLVLTEALVATPVSADTYTIDYTNVDSDIAQMDVSKGLGGSGSNPYGPGASFINAVSVLIESLGATAPSYMDSQAKITAMTEAFGIGSPHAGAGSQGHSGGYLIADMLTQARNAVAGYTVPA